MPAGPSVLNVGAAKPFAGGGMYYAVLGTALPTDASTALAAAYKPLGYLSEDGIRPAFDTSVDKIKAFGGDVVAALLADESRSFEATLLEVFGSEVNTFIYGAGNVTITPATASAGTKTTVQDKGGKPAQCVIVFDLKHGTKRRRVVVPIADPTVTGEEPYTDGGLMAYSLSVEALKNASGVRVYDYLENDDKV
jgi:hypothetical protein